MSKTISVDFDLMLRDDDFGIVESMVMEYLKGIEKYLDANGVCSILDEDSISIG